MKAKSLLTELGAVYEEVNVVENPEAFQAVSEKHSWQTVPMIFIGGEFIGGADELEALHAKGALEAKLKA